MKRSPIWNIIFILGVLYLLVFGFLYVYLRRPVIAEGVDEPPPEVVETDELGAEVDIVDAPLLDEDAADETSIDEASTDEPSIEDSEANAASETDAAALTEDATAPTEDTTLTTPEPAEASTPETAVTETAVTEPDVESADEAATQDIADTTEVGTDDTDDTAANDSEETLLGSSPAYRYDLYALAQNARLETEAGWVTLEGELESPQDEQSYFLVVQSLVREPPTLYSQGELSVDEDGQFATRVKYADFGAFYKTYVITTADEEAAQNLRNKGSSVGLPPNFEVVGREVDVLID